MSDAPERSQSATKRKTRGKTSAVASGRQGPLAGTVTPKLDDETAAALTLYNTYLVADREQQAHERSLRKAEKAKDDAAAAVRKLNDRKAPASEVASAEAAYREAAEALRRLRGGDQAAAQDASDEAEDEADEADEADDGEAPVADTEEEAPAADVEASTKEEAPAAKAEDTADTAEEEAPAAGGEEAAEAQEPESVGVEASVGDDDLAGDEPAGVAG